MKKKILSIILTAVMTFGVLSACGQTAGNNGSTADNNSDTNAEVTTETSVEATSEILQTLAPLRVLVLKLKLLPRTRQS